MDQEDRFRDFLKKGLWGYRLFREERELYEELKAHLMDLYEECLEKGMEEEEAAQKAMADLGDPARIRREWKAAKKKNKRLPNVLTGIVLACTACGGLAILVANHFDDWTENCQGQVSQGGIFCLLFLIGTVFFILPICHRNVYSMKKTLRFFLFALFSDALLTAFFLNRDGILRYDFKVLFVFLYLILGTHLLPEYDRMNRLRKRCLECFLASSLFFAVLNPQKSAFVFLALGYLFAVLAIRKRGVQKLIVRSGIIFLVSLSLPAAAIALSGKQYQVQRLKARLFLWKDHILLQNQADAAERITEMGILPQKPLSAVLTGTIDPLYFWSYFWGAGGFLLSLVLICLFWHQFRRMDRKILSDPDRRAAGVFLGLYLFRFFYSLCMNLGLVWPTGIGLPFWGPDYGFFLFDCLALGVLAERLRGARCCLVDTKRRNRVK